MEGKVFIEQMTSKKNVLSMVPNMNYFEKKLYLSGSRQGS